MNVYVTTEKGEEVHPRCTFYVLDGVLQISSEAAVIIAAYAPGHWLRAVSDK